MRTPDGGNLIGRRQRKLRVIGDVQDREIVVQKCDGQARESISQRKQAVRRLRCGPLPSSPHRYDARPMSGSTPWQTARTAQESARIVQFQESFEFTLRCAGRHARQSCPERACPATQRPRAPCNSRHAWPGSCRRLESLSPPMRPCATTPWPSRNRSGNTPE